MKTFEDIPTAPIYQYERRIGVVPTDSIYHISSLCEGGNRRDYAINM